MTTTLTAREYLTDTVSDLRIVTGREYLRVSTVQSGKHDRSTGDQHSDNVIAAKERKVLLGTAYEDSGFSASMHATKARKDFDKLIDDLRNDQFGADELWLWESSRGSRRVGEWAYLIDLCLDRGVKIWVTSERRLYDLANDRDRIDLLDDAVDSEREVAKLRKRIKRGNRINAEAGLPHGREQYGFERTYTKNHPRMLTGQKARPGEAEVVSELIERLYVALVEKRPREGDKLDSLRSISIDFTQRGIKSRIVTRMKRDKETGEMREETTGGIPFSAQSLRHIALNEAYVGIRVYDTERNQKSNNRPTANAQHIKACWEPIVDVDKFWDVNRALREEDRRTSKPGSGKWLLTMGHGAMCDLCDGPLAVTDRDNRGKQYQCHHKGCVRVDMAELDAIAENLMLDYLSRRDVIEDLARKNNREDPEVNRVRTELAQLRARDTELSARIEDALADGMDESDYVNARVRVRAKVKRLEGQDRELSTPSKFRGLIDFGADIRKQWPALPMTVKREVAKMLLGQDGIIGELRVTRRCELHGNSKCPAEDRTYVRQVPLTA